MENQERAEILLKQLNNLCDDIVRDNQTNEQWALDFLDAINQLSVRF